MKKILLFICLPFSLFANSNKEYEPGVPIDYYKEVDSRDVKSLEVDLSNEDINITTTNSGKIGIRYYGSISGDKVDPEEYIKIRIVSNKLVIERKKKINISFGFSRYDMNLDITIPDMHFKRVELDLSSGDISVDEIECDKLVVDTSSGSFNADYISSRESDFDVSSGSITINNFIGDFKGSGSSGRFNIVVSKYEENDFRIDTSSGSINISLPGDSEFIVDADTSSGSIDIGFPVTLDRGRSRDSLKGRVGEGKGLFKLDTSSGDIKIIQHPDL